MILTEEQREAIKYAISSLEQCGSEPEDPVVAKILGAMIDSSDHIVEHDELIGFDLEKARDAAKFDDRMAITMFPLAIAEIERLRAYNAGLSKAVISIQEERDLAQAEFRAYHKAWEEQSARINDLEDALAEAHGQLFHQFGDMELDPPGEDDCRIARETLQAEGKIGPDARPKCDHAWQAAIEERGYQTCLKCGECRNIEDIPRTAPAWQITEEREAAIMETIDLLNGDLFRSPYSDVLAVLRGMLTEAGQ